MCGVCGFAGAGDNSDLQAMMGAMIHRGPDAAGHRHYPPARLYLGHMRLTIIDLETGHQPMQTSDGRLVVTYNGEIYNYPELRRELESFGHVFRTHHSDTEVLLHGYRQWGEDLPVHLNGMWAFAIYDQSSNRLFLSRDRFGKKPIYYTRQNGTFAFASELTALLKHSRVTASVSQLGLKKYFAYGFIPSPQTIFTGIHKLPGGHNLVVDMKLHEYRERAYWEFVLEPEESPQDENVLNEQLHELLKQAVERRLIS
ncbi:MAG: asparagine synthetase B, partial [Pseudomonadota bacterium]